MAEHSESLSTAVEQQDDVESTVTDLSPERKAETRKRYSSQDETEFDIPGVTKIILSPIVQKSVGCVVGKNVTEEKPWTYVKKELLEDKLELTELSTLKEDISEFPQQDFLLGYIPTTDAEYDEFYLCHTEFAQNTVSQIIKQKQEEQEKIIFNLIYKTPKPWKSLGSEEFVDDFIYKSNRPLLKVEIQNELPFINSITKFCMRRVEDAGDGYKELLPYRTPPNIIKSRIENATQASSHLVSSEAQTVCTYPRSSWTQYDHSPKVNEEIMTEEYEACVKKFLEDNFEIVSNAFLINGYINFYLNDYHDLVLEKAVAISDIKVSYKESISFMDVKLCKGKMIASACWHPILPGILAISYATLSPVSFLERPLIHDEVNSAIYNSNLVLWWSVEDELYPKYVLDTHREVLCLSFCPKNEHILVGGCANGQIIIWDVRQKIIKEENQKQKVRKTFLEETKKMKDTSFVKPIAITSLKDSHNDGVTTIRWISETCEISKTGQTVEVSDDKQAKQLQFVTSGMDGVLLFWNLTRVTSDLLYEQSSHRRLKKLPIALHSYIPPFCIANNKPFYKVDLKENYCCSFYIKFQLEMVEVVDPSTQYDVSSRYGVEVEEQKKPCLVPKLYVGTPKGDFLTAKWKGIDPETITTDLDEHETILMEDGRVLNVCKYHDGPVVSVSHSSLLDAFLTIGGKIFAIWKSDLKDKPVLWRRSSTEYTMGAWNTFRPTMFEIVRADGVLERWELLSRSDHNISEQILSGEALVGYYIHPEKFEEHNFGIADFNGSFRLLQVPKKFHSRKLDEERTLIKLLEREVDRKSEFINWQKEWVKRHVHEQVEVKEKPLRRMPKSGRKVVLDTKVKKLKLEDKERIRLNKVLLDKKRLNKELLVEQQKPLMELKESEKRKNQKIAERTKELNKVFNQKIAMHFPEVVRPKTPPPENPYKTKHSTQAKLECFEEYQKDEEELNNYIKNNPFVYELNWNKVLANGHEVRQYLDTAREKITHRQRNEDRKIARRIAAEEAEKAKRLAKIAAEKVKLTKRVGKRPVKKTPLKEVVQKLEKHTGKKT